MSYIAFDLDALNVARDVGAAAGLPEERITHGLLRMWAWCFREKRDTVSAIQVQGFFSATAAPALVAFGFLTATGDTFRVRGAERYLRVSEARSRGGHAAKTNLIPGGPKARPSRGVSRGGVSAPAEVQPRGGLGSTSALTPSTEHLAPNTSRKDAGPAAPDLRHQPLIGALTAAFAEVRGSKYPFTPRDAKSAKALLALAEPDAIEAAWRRALRHQGYPTISTFAELEKHLARFLGTGPPATQRGPADVPLWTNDDAGEIHP